MGGILLVVMLVGGVPVSSPMALQTTDSTCASEMQIISGINRSLLDVGSTVRYYARCVDPSKQGIGG